MPSAPDLTGVPEAELRAILTSIASRVFTDVNLEAATSCRAFSDIGFGAQSERRAIRDLFAQDSVYAT